MGGRDRGCRRFVLIVATSIGPPGEVFQAVARVVTPAAHEEQPASPADEFGENLATEISFSARASPAGLRAVERIGADATVLASQVTTSGLVDVAVTAATEAAAIDGANGFADAYVAERSAALAVLCDEAIERGRRALGRAAGGYRLRRGRACCSSVSVRRWFLTP